MSGVSWSNKNVSLSCGRAEFDDASFNTQCPRLLLCWSFNRFPEFLTFGIVFLFVELIDFVLLHVPLTVL